MMHEQRNVFEDYCLLVYDAIWSDSWVSTFWTNLLSLSLNLKSVEKMMQTRERKDWNQGAK
jgi:hypothetical protein